MNLQEVMQKSKFAVVGNTLDPEKYASRIKNELIRSGYTVYAVGKELASLNDIEDDIEVIDLCIHPAKGLMLLKECKKPFEMIVIQPGAADDQLIAYLEEQKLPYMNGCLLVGMKQFPREK